MAEQQAANDGEAKLSAAYASRYYVAQELPPADNTLKLGATCGNCGGAVSAVEGEQRAPLCKVCWAMLQQSIKRAAKQGFRIG